MHLRYALAQVAGLSLTVLPVVLLCLLSASVNDWTLGLLYRVHSSSSIWLQAAGMYKVGAIPQKA